MPDFPKTVFTLDFRVDYYASEDGPCCITGDFEGPSANAVHHMFAAYLLKFPVVFRCKTKVTRQSFKTWHDNLWESVEHGYPKDRAMERVRKVAGLS